MVVNDPKATAKLLRAISRSGKENQQGVIFETAADLLDPPSSDFKSSSDIDKAALNATKEILDAHNKAGEFPMVDYEHNKLYVYDGTSQTFDPVVDPPPSGFKPLYYVKWQTIFQRPVTTSIGTKMGFAVCEVRDGVDPEEVCAIMNRGEPATEG